MRLAKEKPIIYNSYLFNLLILLINQFLYKRILLNGPCIKLKASTIDFWYRNRFNLEYGM